MWGGNGSAPLVRWQRGAAGGGVLNEEPYAEHLRIFISLLCKNKLYGVLLGISKVRCVHCGCGLLGLVRSKKEERKPPPFLEFAAM